MKALVHCIRYQQTTPGARESIEHCQETRHFLQQGLYYDTGKSNLSWKSPLTKTKHTCSPPLAPQLKFIPQSNRAVMIASKPPLTALLTNTGGSSSGVSWTAPNGSFDKNEALVDVLTCTRMQATADGGLTVQVKNGLPQVWTVKMCQRGAMADLLEWIGVVASFSVERVSKSLSVSGDVWHVCWTENVELGRESRLCGRPDFDWCAV